MNRKRSQLQSYFAGIFDGEGHVGIRRTADDSFVLQVMVNMNDPQAVLLMWREYPEAHTRLVQNASGTQGYHIQYSQHKAYTFLKELLPFTIVKHEQLKIALAFLAHRRRDHVNDGWMKGQPRGTRKPVCERCAKYEQQLKAVRAESKRVNSVNALLEHQMREYRAKPEEVSNDVAAMSAKVTELLEGLETRLSQATDNKAISAREQDIVQKVA
jgi:hypothetical protein